jgi:hypothetical protein
LGSAIGISARAYDGPTGERLDRWGFHLNEDPIAPAHTEPAEPAPELSGQRSTAAHHDPSRPEVRAATDPTRAGPTLA